MAGNHMQKLSKPALHIIAGQTISIRLLYATADLKQQLMVPAPHISKSWPGARQRLRQPGADSVVKA